MLKVIDNLRNQVVENIISMVQIKKWKVQTD